MRRKKQTYAESLRDPRWQRKRLEILQRDNFTCQSCGTTEKELHVHHGYYETGLSPWEYDNDTLTTLCKNCHIHMGVMTSVYHKLLASLPPVELKKMLFESINLLAVLQEQKTLESHLDYMKESFGYSKHEVFERTKPLYNCTWFKDELNTRLHTKK